MFEKIQQINFNHIEQLINKYNLDSSALKEKDFFEKKLFKKTKGKLKLLNIKGFGGIKLFKKKPALKKAGFFINYFLSFRTLMFTP